MTAVCGEQDSSGKAARAAVGVALEEFGGRLAQLRGPEYAALHNPLAAFDAVPYLQLPQPAFLGEALESREAQHRAPAEHAWLSC